MSTNPDFSMIVDRVVGTPQHGVMVTGIIAGGDVQVGDAVQVRNGGQPTTVIVQQIAVGAETATKASPGVQAVLLLDGLRPADVHLGSQLVAGREEDVVQPAVEKELEWPKLPERIEPLQGTWRTLGSLASLAFIALFWIAPIVMFMSNVSITWGIPPWLFLVIWYGILSFITFSTVRKFLRSLRGRRAFREGNTSARASILRRRVVVHSGKYGDTYTYHLQVEFDPTLAEQPTGRVQYEISINKKRYQQLGTENIVQVTYARQNPQIFIIEGE